MKDRIPTYPGRIELTDVETGVKRKYDMTMADEPTQEGDAPVKKNLLKDETLALYGLDLNAVPDDVFKRISKLLGGFIVKVYVQFAGVPAGPGVSVTGMNGVNGESLVTDEDGAVVGLIHSKTATITVSKSTVEEEDLKAAQNTFTIDSNYQSYSETTVNLVASAQGFVLVTASKTVKFSASTKTVDIFLQAAGEGGVAAAQRDSDYNVVADGGSPGEQKTFMGVSLPDGYIECIIGSGGKGATANAKESGLHTSNGEKGGDTKAVINGTEYLAVGGQSHDGDGADGKYPFGSATFGSKYGAEGGAGLSRKSYGDSAKNGGNYGGGNGAVKAGTVARASDAYGYGSGGGGAAYGQGGVIGYAYAGDGYQGCIVVRWGY